MTGRDTVGEAQGFVSNFGLGGMTHVFDPDGSLWGRVGISYQPAWIFVNDDGTATLVPGALGEERLTEELDKLIAS